MKLVLASRSDMRRQMLGAAGVPFEVRTGAGDEEAEKARLRGEGVGALVLASGLAAFKAADVPAGTGELVLGADQILEKDDGSTFDKPRSRDEAAAQLRALSGRTHRLHSSAVIVEAGSVLWSATETASLAVRELSDAFVSYYLDREFEAVRHNVGGYRIEGAGIQLFEAIDGSHFAILGLPLLPLLAYLRARGLVPS